MLLADELAGQGSVTPERLVRPISRARIHKFVWDIGTVGRVKRQLVSSLQAEGAKFFLEETILH